MFSLRKNCYQSLKLYEKNVVKTFSTSPACTQNEEKIVIPNRIERGPTDILKAISQTVKKDPLAPHYKFHDDPYTIPVSNMGKRSYALAQESGRKAAQWIRDTHSDLFQHKVAEPFIEALAPKLIYKEDQPATVELLSQLISNSSVTDAIKTYQHLEKENIEVSPELKQSLLELVCYFNCEDTLPEDLLEERWFTQTKYIIPNHNTWKDNDFAETLFRSFENPGTEQFASLIQGMLKYNQVDRAFTLIEEAKSKGMVLPIATYNLLIAKTHFHKEGFDQRWQHIVDILSEINQAKLKPDIETFNCILKQLSGMASFRDAKKLALQTLGEMKKFDIKPSLASYNHLLFLFCRDRGPVSGILYSILDDLETRIQNGEEITVRDPMDNYFFSGAMEISKRHLSDVNCAYRIDRLLHTANNYNFIGNAFKESAYYRNFFQLAVSQEPFETFMELYDRLVPNVYSPEKAVMEDIITFANMNGSIEYFPRIWSELVMLEHWQQEDLLALFVEGLYKNIPLDNSQLSAQLADVAWSVYSKVEEQNEKSQDIRTKKRSLEWTATMLGHIMSALLADGRVEQADILFQRLTQDSLAGVVELKPLEDYFNAVLDQRNLLKSMSILQYISELGYDNIQHMGEKLQSNFELSSGETTKLLSIIGSSREKAKVDEE